MQDFRARCLAGDALIGTFLSTPHPVAVEVVAATPIDFVCIDGEHAQIGRERIEEMIRAADVHRKPVIVRVPGHAPESIASALDAGATGILVPRVSTAAQARAAVDASRYPPVGSRGVGPGRAQGYGYRIFDYLKQANEKVVVALQIETAEGLANIEEIAAVDGVDVLFVGPGDLSVSLGALGPEHVERLNTAILDIVKAGRARSRALGIYRPSAADVGKWREAGVSFFIVASDAMLLGETVSAMVADAKAAAAG